MNNSAVETVDSFKYLWIYKDFIWATHPTVVKKKTNILDLKFSKELQLQHKSVLSIFIYLFILIESLYTNHGHNIKWKCSDYT